MLEIEVKYNNSSIFETEVRLKLQISYPKFDLLKVAVVVVLLNGDRTELRPRDGLPT